MQSILRGQHRARLATVSAAALASFSLATPALADVGQTCRFRADGKVGQTVSIIVPQGLRTAIVAAVVDGSTEKSGATLYTRDQLVGLNTLILARRAEGDRAFISSPDNQVTCLSRLIGDAVSQIDATRE